MNTFPPVTEINFSDLRSVKDFSMVVLGASQPETWVKGIAELLVKEEIVKCSAEKVFKSAALIKGNILGDEGRADLLLTFNIESEPAVGRLAMWRLRFGDVSWLEDFVVNYRKDYNTETQPEETEEEYEN